MRWQAFTRNCTQLGTGNALLYYLGRALSITTRGWARVVKYRIVAQPTRVRNTTRPRRCTGAVRRASPNDAVVKAFPRNLDVIRSRFERENTCYVIEVKGNFAGYIWLAGDGYEEDEVRCRYDFVAPAQCSWDYDVFVAPEYRLTRVFQTLWDTVNEELSRSGVSWSCSRISAFNFGSLAAHRRLGAHEIAGATFLCLGRFQLMIADVPPFFHLGIGDARPCLRLPQPVAADD